MRLTDTQHNKRLPPPPPYKFREMLPMVLKDKVSGKGGKQHDVACMPEMMTLFSCLAEKNYDSQNCGKETAAFQKCYDAHRAKKAQYKATGSQGILVPGMKASQLTPQQANTLLKMYPVTKIMRKIKY
ncbi:uncharacterized protein LOC135367969 [Ornithodoros turicata]|uniref:CHCH domain-containing protein n=1 Tax=Ornithodoros turicata TaxID=34597 RepID=A0A2R5LFL2_9ACAR